MKRTSKKVKAAVNKPRKSQPRTKTQLGKTSSHVADILESISDSFVAFDAQMNYIYINEKVAQILREDRRNVDL